MEACFMGFILLICGIAWLVQHLSDQDLESQIRRASLDGNTSDLQRLYRIRREKEQKKRQAQQRAAAVDQGYMDAIMVLDAAEHGVFVPNPEQYFDHLGEDPADDYEDDRWDNDESRNNDDDNSRDQYEDDRGDQYEYPEDY